MSRDQEDLLLSITTDWNPTVGHQLSAAIHAYRHSGYYAKQHDEQFIKDMAHLLDHIGEQIEQRPDNAKETVARALRLLDQPLRAAS